MKIILNKSCGGFEVSDEAYELYAKKKGVSLYRYYDNYAKYVLNKTKIKGGAGFLTYYFTKDYGDNVRKREIDWETYLYLNSKHRDDPILIEVIEELGRKANGNYAGIKSKLVVVEIPDDLDYVIDDYDGFETLHERKVIVW